MSNEAFELLEIFQHRLGSTRAKCDGEGKKLWDRIEGVKFATIDAQLYASELHAAIIEVGNAERRPGKLPVEPMIRLIRFAHTGSVKTDADCKGSA